MSELFVAIPSWMTVAQAEVFMNTLSHKVGYQAEYDGFNSYIRTRNCVDCIVKFIYLGERSWTDEDWDDVFYIRRKDGEEFNPEKHVNAVSLHGSHLVDRILDIERRN